MSYETIYSKISEQRALAEKKIEALRRSDSTFRRTPKHGLTRGQRAELAKRELRERPIRTEREIEAQKVEKYLVELKQQESSIQQKEKEGWKAELSDGKIIYTKKVPRKVTPEPLRPIVTEPAPVEPTYDPAPSKVQAMVRELKPGETLPFDIKLGAKGKGWAMHPSYLGLPEVIEAGDPKTHEYLKQWEKGVGTFEAEIVGKQQQRVAIKRLKESDTEVGYLLKHAEPQEIKQLEQAVFKGEHRLEPAAQAAYVSLAPSEKTEYGFKYQPFKEEPAETWKHYPGGKEYFESLPKKQQEEIAHEWGKEHIKYDFWSGFGSTYWSQWKVDDRPIESIRIKELSEPKDIRIKIGMEEITKTPSEIKGEIYAKIPQPVKLGAAISQQTFRSFLWPITLPQAVIKKVTGKTHILPDIEKEISKGYVGPPGVISPALSEVWFDQDVSEIKKMQKEYPLETAFATAGEIFGLFLGGKAVGILGKGVKGATVATTKKVVSSVYKQFPKGWERAFPKLQPLKTYVYGKVPTYVIKTRPVGTYTTEQAFKSGGKVISDIRGPGVQYGGVETAHLKDIFLTETKVASTMTGKLRMVGEQIPGRGWIYKVKPPSLISKAPSKISKGITSTYPYRLWKGSFKHPGPIAGTSKESLAKFFKTGYKRFVGEDVAIGKTKMIGGEGTGQIRLGERGELTAFKLNVKRILGKKWGKDYIPKKEAEGLYGTKELRLAGDVYYGLEKPIKTKMVIEGGMDLRGPGLRYGYSGRVIGEPAKRITRFYKTVPDIQGPGYQYKGLVKGYIGESKAFGLGKDVSIMKQTGRQGFKQFIKNVESSFGRYRLKDVGPKIKVETGLDISKVKFGTEYGGYPYSGPWGEPKPIPGPYGTGKQAVKPTPGGPFGSTPARLPRFKTELDFLKWLEEGTSAGVHSFWKGVAPGFPTTVGRDILSGIGKGIQYGSGLLDKDVQTDIKIDKMLRTPAFRSEIGVFRIKTPKVEDLTVQAMISKPKKIREQLPGLDIALASLSDVGFIQKQEREQKMLQRQQMEMELETPMMKIFAPAKLKGFWLFDDESDKKKRKRFDFDFSMKGFIPIKRKFPWDIFWEDM